MALTRLLKEGKLDVSWEGLFEILEVLDSVHLETGSKGPI